MTYLGDFVAGQTVRAWWNTNAIAGESITRATNGTVSIYKDGSTTQSTAGVTDTEDFDGLTGVHQVAIDTSADGTFYAAGSEFAVVLSAATIDGKTINAVLAQFSIENRNDKADVREWLGTAVATPAVAGRPSVDAIAVSGDTTAADNLEAQFDGTGLTGDTYPARQDALELAAANAATAASQSTAANAKFGSGITSAAGQQVDDWFIASMTSGATAPTAASAAGFVPATDSLEAIANAAGPDPLTNAVPGSYASGTAGYVLGNLQDRSVNVVTPFELATAKITLGFGEDYTSGSTNGLLTIDTTASINLLTAGGTIYFAVRRRNVTINSDPEFTLTGVASDADTFTVSVSNTYTRMLTPGTYLWTAWHVTALGVRTDIGHGNYVIEDLAQPTVS